MTGRRWAVTTSRPVRPREIEAYNRLTTANKRLLPDPSHMTLYSSKSHLEIAAEQTMAWLGDQLSVPTT